MKNRNHDLSRPPMSRRGPIDVETRARVCSRRSSLKTLVAGASALGWNSASWPRCDGDDASLLFVDDEVDVAVKAGVDHLIERQRPDGAIADRGHPVAMTSLAVMAMAAIGITPAVYDSRGRAMTSAINYVIDRRNQEPNGYFGARDNSRMYGHGITTLMLTEILGMGVSVDQNKRIHDGLVDALGLILAAQRVPKPNKLRGGWRYTPNSRDSDLSVSVWQLMALRSAKNDGMDVPGQAIESALVYLRNSRVTAGGDDDSIGFSYTPGNRNATFTMTSAGLLAMQVCGQYESPLVAGAARWLMANPPRQNERFFYYGIYYYAQGMHQVGGRYAEHADRFVPRLLLGDQRDDGSWIARGGEERNVGIVYATALAVLALSVRYHYLPIYQR